MDDACAMREPIAVVGSACRFPGGTSTPSKLWDLLRTPRDVGQRIPADRFSADGFYHVDAEHHGTSDVNKGYFLSEDHRHFDAAFFNSNPREAEVLDPQQRILLETTYEAIESAGFTLKAMRGTNTSVYVGLMGAEYFDLHLRDTETVPQYLASCNARCIVSNRLSYFFDWKGPSVTIDTACSSSLVALHQAVQSLRIGEASVAVAAGANLLLGPEVFIMESNLHMISPTGRSMMWDSSADGYARGEGFTVVILKTLSNALRDGDHIECIVRETGVNSDGRTRGITMPDATSQTALIRQTYKRAGLDCSRKSDRCQFFEAHGTGTPVGDPIEAEAVRNAFFPPLDEIGGRGINGVDNGRLLVGSIKTIIGHLEGAAGLAGVLKASLAVQNSIVTPNMHFRRLNPNIIPFYEHLQIPTEVQEWPAVPEGYPRRASVNSFGFGGANAHAIIESFDVESLPYHCARLRSAPILLPIPAPTQGAAAEFAGPLVLSAHSERALTATIENMSNFLKVNRMVNLRDLIWTMQSRRSVLPVKVAFSGLGREKLIEKMDEQVQSAREAGGMIGIQSRSRSPDCPARILGVFTGQGAQWASMGQELVKSSHVFSHSISLLERSLAELPDSPEWSLSQELMAEAPFSRLDMAEISQPLCTAVQIGLVDLLDRAGISFDAVIGHSSGEIACAYAAGYLTAPDAIRVAYYRGLHARLAGNSAGGRGAMMAVGISFDEASEFCAQAQFANRIAVAASNAPESVTLSGDLDAIQDAKVVFDDRKTFARLLKVDTAYHSHHMRPCSEPYLKSLRACKVEVQIPKDSCPWISSVVGPRGSPSPKSLKDSYWERNMISPVLFSQATERVLSEKGPFDIILEVGPHPALKGPTTQTVKRVDGASIPYHGLLRRGENDIEAFSDSIGFVWSHLGESAVDFEGYASAFSNQGGANCKVVKGLPPYSWDHGQIFWKESRLSKQYRLREKPHELLGARCPDDTDQEIRWRNIIIAREAPWLSGHRVQGQVVVPAAYYCVMALEASKVLSRGEATRLTELQDFVIYRAITLEDASGVETIFSLNHIDTIKDGDTDGPHVITADFLCQSCTIERGDPMAKIFSGRLRVEVGSPSPTLLPKRTPTRPDMWPIDTGRFYKALANIGLNYSGVFQKIISAERRLSMATASISKLPIEGLSTELVVHPTILDMAFQSVFAAIASPDDGAIKTPFLPTTIRNLRIGPIQCRAVLGFDAVNMDSFCTDQSAPSATASATITADIDIFSSGDDQVEIQVEGLTLTSLPTKPTDDRRFFAQIVWSTDISGGVDTAVTGSEDSLEDSRLIDACERASYYYFRNLLHQVPKENIPSLEWHHKRMMEFTEYIVSTIDTDKPSNAKKEWSDDTHEQILDMLSKFPGRVDAELVRAVGENLPSVLTGQTAILEVMRENSMLDRFYEKAVGYVRANRCLGSVAKQIAHRYPRMNILEIGAGTGGATKGTLEALGDTFSSYLFTDISPAFFENARETFRRHSHKMTYRVLDVESDPVPQGFPERSFDIVIASNVLHATRKLENTLNHVRKLLKPGGYLLLLEITGQLLQAGLVFGGLPGWWLGYEDDRPHGPTISIGRWDSLLRKTGFAGVDWSASDFKDFSKHACSVMVCQAIDEQVELLREPLQSLTTIQPKGKLLVIGGNTPRTARLVEDTRVLLSCWEDKILAVKALEDLSSELLCSATTVLSLVELERPIFESTTPESLKAMQAISNRASKVLWVTHDTRDDNPYGNMTIGLGRSILMESPNIRFQFLSLEDSDVLGVDARAISEMLLRLMMADSPALSDGSVLWTTETELVLKGGKLLIPRISPIPHMDDRLNSARRFITKPVDPLVSTVESVWSASSYVFTEAQPLDDLPQDSAGHVSIRVTQSSLKAIKIMEETYLFLCIGVVTKTGAKAIALSRTNASIINVPPGWLRVCDIPLGQEHRILALAIKNIRAQVLVDEMPVDRTILHEPDILLASIIADRALQRGKQVQFTTSKENPPPGNNPWTFIHGNSPLRTIKSSLPKDIKMFVDFSEPGVTGPRMQECLPPSCKIQSIASFHNVISKPPPDSLSGSIQAMLADACLVPLTTNYQASYEPDTSVVHVEDVPSCTAATRIIDWSRGKPLPVQVKPIDPQKLLTSDKTYLLFGLGGELGQSLCRWMATNGATHIIVAHRNPSTNTRWLEELRETGITIDVISLDVTDKTALQNFCDQVQKTWPSVAGIANGAMVLKDKLFADMSYEDLNQVLRPKFLTGLAAQRRKRGLAASVIDIGMILGMGYVERSALAVVDNLRKNNCMPVSETDFHSAIAEAIVAGRPTSPQHPEIIIGLDRVGIADERKPMWYGIPLFSHHVIDREAVASPDDSREAKKPAIPVTRQLSDVKTEEEALKILMNAFCSKIESVLQLPSNGVNKTASLITLGVDSLVAIEVRSWFLKEVHVDMSVLKVLSDASATDLCIDAISRLSLFKPVLTNGLTN
ncbi:MAG: Type I Iterative PKS [Trichoglossum hirsutum]|nr:MAG: Type I Iterative PKS [Trichoglossum hirsutum]